jgi:LPXTG-site transpeptidase (sortase) family protein
LHKVTVQLSPSQDWNRSSFVVTRAYDIHQPLLRTQISDQHVTEHSSHSPTTLLVSGIAAASLLVFGSLFVQSRSNDRTVIAATDTTTYSTTVPPKLSITDGQALPAYSKFPVLTQQTTKELLGDVPDDGRTWLVIPRLHLRIPVVKGIEDPQLAKGVGWYPSTDAPGASGNVGIAGHRTTSPAPFFFLDKLEVADSIYLVVKNKLFRYLVTASEDDTAYKIVPPSQVSVIGRLGFDAVTLTTCTPMGSDAERLIVHAKLLRSAVFSRK